MQLCTSRRETKLVVEALNLMQLHESVEKGMFQVVQMQKCMTIREEHKPLLIMTLSYSLALEKLLPFSKLHALSLLFQMF